jgi:hypothetical protein
MFSEREFSNSMTWASAYSDNSDCFERESYCEEMPASVEEI